MNAPRPFVACARACCAAAAGLSLSLLAPAPDATAQPAPANGPREVDPRWHALIHATLVPAPGKRVEDATIVFRDGMIQSVEAAGAAPAGSRVWDCSGLTVYAGLIDAHLPVEAPKPDGAKPGAHWNSKVTPQRSALDGSGADEKTKKELREMGFAAAVIAPKAGVFRGQSALVLLDGDASEGSTDRPDVVMRHAFHEVAFETGGFQNDQYPSSEMGTIALIRQTLLDAEWHAESLRVYRNAPTQHEPVPPGAALEALQANTRDSRPLLFDCADELQAIRAAKIATEFNRWHIVLGSGTEFRRLAAIVADKTPFILPLNFPEKPKVASPAEAEAVSLRELMTWEQAPTNPRRLDAAGVMVALTTDKLKKRSDFRANLRKAIEHGLTEDKALEMLTTRPAYLLDLDDRLGEVKPGALANLVIADGPLFAEKTKIRDVWVGGRRFEITPAPIARLEGGWDVTFSLAEPVTGEITIDKDNKVVVKAQGAEGKARDVAVRENRLSFLVDGSPWKIEGVHSLGAVVEGDRMFGRGVSPTQGEFEWSAVRRPPGDKPQAPEAAAKGEEDAAAADEKADEADEAEAAVGDGAPRERRPKKKPEVPEQLPTPFGAYGLLSPPERPDAILISDTTVWTCGPDGIIEHADVLLVGGKVKRIGRSPIDLGDDLKVDVIDGQRKHVTPGLIDCHSHTGISGSVNEGTQAVTAEVRIFDVIDPDDVAWWRELAGGLTAVNQLHGSANPIGGQNSVVKIRWGCERPDDMRIDSAIGGIKFALGENVKQANWGEKYTTRYPQTRMGVETIIRDRFIAARDYADERRRYESLATPERERSMPPRRDLELEALAEILAGKRLIHCHSYRQDEILMLCRVAREFGFTIGTFQHVLEGYKVAEAIRQAAIGGSTFSDWWGYKWEVFDAIPENGAIMTEVGVPVSFNSDSDELARRMNYEAAKAVKYGGVAPAEALKFVTLNPAKQLRIDDRVGSLEPGKDADFVIWSGSPLSAFSRCEATYVDGAEVFSLELDRELRERAAAERKRILQKLLVPDKSEGPLARGERGERREGESTPTVAGGGREGPRPGSLMERIQAEALERHNLELLKAGIDPDSHRCGVCGVFDFAGGLR